MNEDEGHCIKMTNESLRIWKYKRMISSVESTVDVAHTSSVLEINHYAC